jgi:hypothetical protein
MSELAIRSSFIYDPIEMAFHIERNLGACFDRVAWPITSIVPEWSKANLAIFGETPFPYMGMHIVKAYINYLIDAQSEWINGRVDLQTYIQPYVLSEFQDIANLDMILDQVILTLVQVKFELCPFLGDDRWIMHFTRWRYTDLIIEKAGDYRIHSYMATRATNKRV